MDQPADLEMSSPKRRCVEASRSEDSPLDNLVSRYDDALEKVQASRITNKDGVQQQEGSPSSPLPETLQLPGLASMEAVGEIPSKNNHIPPTSNLDEGEAKTVATDERQDVDEDTAMKMKLEPDSVFPLAATDSSSIVLPESSVQLGNTFIENTEYQSVDPGKSDPNEESLQGGPDQANEQRPVSTSNDTLKEKGSRMINSADHGHEDKSMKPEEDELTQPKTEHKQHVHPEIKQETTLLNTTPSADPTSEDFPHKNNVNGDAEFEIDSSPLGSSSSDTTTDSSSSDDSDADNSDAEDYEMLSPAEQARRLMAEDGGGEGQSSSGVPRTQNEKPEEVVQKPQVSITEDMKIEELGLVESLVENLALIKAKTSGEYQVLESGSVLCLESRSVIGVVGETLGRVQQPYYSVRFTNMAAIAEAGVAHGTKIFYVCQFSTTVFTEPLKAYKGSDASNLHDEEVGDDELEFSDDEAEAEHRRQAKLQRRAKYDAKHGTGDGFSRGPQQILGAASTYIKPMASLAEKPPDLSEPSLNYDDGEDNGDDLYIPLARPANLHEMMANNDKTLQDHGHQGAHSRSGRGRGRGDRGATRGGRQRGNDRGGRSDRRTQHRGRGNVQSHAHPHTGPRPSSGFPHDQAHSRQTNPLPPRPPNEIGPHPESPHLPAQQSSYPSQPTPQSHAHPNYPTHYPSQYLPQYPSYGQSQPQSYHQPQYSPYQPVYGAAPQASFSQQGFSPTFQVPPQPTPPATPAAAAIPPGAHINPNFFRQQGQQTPQSWSQQHAQASFPTQHYHSP